MQNVEYIINSRVRALCPSFGLRVFYPAQEYSPILQLFPPLQWVSFPAAVLYPTILLYRGVVCQPNGSRHCAAEPVHRARMKVTGSD